MKSKLLALLFLLISITSFSQILDTTFGVGGKVITPGGVYQDVISSIALQPDGKIVASGESQGYSGTGDVYQTVVFRYNSDGSLDSSFGTNGKVAFPYLFDHPDRSHLKLQPDGKILVATNEGASSNFYNFLLVRLNSDGSFDTSFGTNGIVDTDFDTLGNSENIDRAIELQPDGKIILAGENSANGFGNTQYENFAVARYNSDGTLDTAFGTNGRFEINIGSNSVSSYSIDGIYSVKLQSNGKIILGGYTDAQNTVEVDNFCLVRLNADGSLDTTFGTNGKVITSFGNNTGVSSLIVTTNDEIIAGGIVNFNSNSATKIGLAKYDINGNLNVTFGNNGKVITQINSTAMVDTIWDMALQPDNKIVAAGYSVGSTVDAVLLRYNADGTLDTSFDTDGILLTDFNSTSDAAFTLLIQPDGKIVAGGLSGASPNYEFALARYTSTNLNIANIDRTFFSVYPNPTTSVLNIQNVNNIPIDKITITDMLSKKVLEQVGGTDINVQSVKNGIYIIQIMSDGRLFTYKFIKN